MRFLSGIIGLLFISIASAATEFDFKADVDNLNPTLGQRLSYIITLSGTSTSLPEIKVPDFDGFDVAVGPSVSTSISMLNASITSTKTYTYVLRPNRTGTLTIAPAQFKHRNRTYTTRSINIEVVGTSSSPGTSAPSTTDPQPGKNHIPKTSGSNDTPEVFITAITDKSTLYKLDMAVVTYRLYLRVNVSNYNIVRLPQSTGFWQEEFDIPQRPTLQDVSIRGVPYKVAIIRKVGLFPTRAGTLTLDPLVADVTVERPVGRRSRDPFDSFWDDPFFGSRVRREVVSTSTDPIVFNILDLPEANKPAGFRGDVGDYSLRVEYDKQELNQNDALTVKVTVSGNGYLKSVEAPKLDIPSGFDIFPPTIEEKISLSGESLRGRKTFTYLVIPRRSGPFTIPPVTFSFFKPTDKTYKSIEAGGLQINVARIDNAETGVIGSIRSSEISLIDSDIRFIKSPSGKLAQANIPPYRSTSYYILLLVPAFLFLSGISVEKVQELRLSNPIIVRRRRAFEKTPGILKDAEKLAHQNKPLLAIETLTKGLLEVIGAVLNEPTAGLTSDVIKQKLSEKNTDDTITTELLRLISEGDRIRFGAATISTNEVLKIIQQFRNMLDKLKDVR